MQRVCLVLVTVFATAAALNNGLALKPQMGWNSWNHFSIFINQDYVKQTADAMVSTGLLAAGYEYCNVDDGWAWSRDAAGTIQADPNTFKDGMAALASYVHSKGLKFGLYSDAGRKTCAERPGSLGHEVSDANTYASWGVDYLKYDNCYDDGTKPEVRYPVMRDALNKTGRPILFSMCEWGIDDPATWAPAVGNSWRTTPDIDNNWDRVLINLLINDKWAAAAGPGAWNDPDMLEVGNGGLTLAEERSHFSLWCLVKAPLLIGCNVFNMSADTLAILTAPEVIAVNQDPLGVQGKRISSQNNLEVWAGPVQDGVAAVLFNRSPATANITINFSDVGMAFVLVRDLWARQDVGLFDYSFTSEVPSHDVRMIKITPHAGARRNQL